MLLKRVVVCLLTHAGRLFFTSIASGAIGIVLLLGCIVYLLTAVFAFRDRQHLQLSTANGSYIRLFACLPVCQFASLPVDDGGSGLTRVLEVFMFGKPASDDAFVALLFISVPLAVLAAFMLIQLTLFHISLSTVFWCHPA